MGRPSSRRPRGWGALAGLAAVAGSYLAVRSGRSARVDARAAALAARPLGRAADRAIGAATDLGSIYGLAGVSGALYLAGHRRRAVDVAAAGLLAWGIAQGTKPLLPRARPYEDAGATRLVSRPAGTSWPSGHAAVVAAMGTILVPDSPGGARLGLVAAAGGVGASRLYVGVHHLTDVVAGYGVGAVSATAWRLVRRRS